MNDRSTYEIDTLLSTLFESQLEGLSLRIGPKVARLMVGRANDWSKKTETRILSTYSGGILHIEKVNK